MKHLKIKILTLIIMIGFSSKNYAQVTTSLYDVEFFLNSLEGEKIDFKKFKGKKILFVNVASKCGFTSQYEGLQKLHELYKDKLVVIGIPCNQFGSQEPGNSKEIAAFCEKNYGVEFLITEKIDVKGNNQHLLYKWLTNETENGKVDAKVKWNFQKYLIDEDGKMIDYFISPTKPQSDKIINLL